MKRRNEIRSIRVIAAMGLLALGVTACAGNGGSPEDPAADASEEKLRISLITGDNRDPFFLTVRAGAEAAAEEHNVELDWQGPERFDANLQIPILNAVLAKSPDAALICATDATALLAPMSQFLQAEIPVIDGLGCGPVGDSSASLGSIDTDNYEGGQAAGQYLVDALPPGSKVGYVGLAPGSAAGDARQKGFEDAVQAGGLEYIGPEYVDHDSTKAAAATSALLLKHPDVRGFFGVNDTYSVGIGTAVKEAGLEEEIEIVAYDGTAAEVKLLENEVFDALIVQPAYQLGYEAVTMAAEYVRDGVEIPNAATLEVLTVTRDNLDDPAVQRALYVG